MPTLKKTYGKYTISISNPDKVLLPPAFTKEEIVNYYDAIADTMVPYLKNRPLMMHRFPDGLSGESFYQKDASDYFPEWIKRAQVPKEGGYNHFVVCQNRATLVYIATQACITPHIWLSKIDKLHYPDHLIFDLDPSGEDFTPIRTIALSLKMMFDTLGLTSFVMTTGSRGLHVIVPLNRTLEFKEVKAFATQCAHILLKEHPDLTTLEIRKEKRGQKVFIDTLRNQYGSTAVAPYAIRARPGAPVATPLHWDEVKDPHIHPQSFNIKNLFKRLDSIKDPWEDFLATRQSLSKAQHIVSTAIKSTTLYKNSRN